MIQFEHLVNYSEAVSDYINLNDDRGNRYGSKIAKEDTMLTVFDGRGRKFEMRRLHNNQLSKCTRWFRANDIKPDTIIVVRFDDRESDDRGNPVLHLIAPFKVERMSDSQMPLGYLFIREGKQYEIRRSFDGVTLRVRAFLDGKPANGFAYSVDLPVAGDFRKLTGSPAYEALLESAKSDIVNRAWEKIHTFFTNGADVA